LSGLKVNPSIIEISETWLSADNEKYYNIPNYCLVSCPRIKKRGGGVGLYISNKLCYSVGTDLDLKRFANMLL